MTRSIVPYGSRSALLTHQSLTSSNVVMSADEPLGFLCFYLGDRLYGVDLDLVCEIVKPPALTKVPRIDPFILGVISIRGQVVTLVDLRQLMDLEPTSWPRTTRILVVEIEGEHIGLLVDKVTQVKRISISELEKNPALCEEHRADHVLFISRPTADELLVIIDLDTILGEKIQ
ncbi:MAG: purine-binding chemotaxis protein CheW [Proteobacteria bacterium]|nr:purine-binding chemotaxis protein CheW [Pseudomonadota bacterium]